MTTADLLVYSWSGGPSVGVWDAGASAGVYGSSFGGLAAFAGPVKFDPVNKHFVALHNGVGGSSGGVNIGNDGSPRLFRWNGTTWVRDAADTNPPASLKPTGAAWHNGDLLLRTHPSNTAGMTRYNLTTNTFTTFVLPGSGPVTGALDVIGDVIYYYDNSAGTNLLRYNLATSTALSPITLASRGAFDVRSDGRIVMLSTSVYIYSASGALVATHTPPGSGTLRAVHWSKGDPTHYWLMRASGFYEIDSAGSTVRSFLNTQNDQFDVLPANPPVLSWGFNLSFGQRGPGL